MDNSLWTIDTEDAQRVLKIDLDKNEGPHWWPFVVEGEPSIDVSKIEPPPVHLNALDGDLRSEVEKMIVVLIGSFSVDESTEEANSWRKE